MFIAMNRFKIVKGKEEDFETVWRNRETHLDGVDGFHNFCLVRGEQTKDYTLYASHSTWETRQHFSDWTKSDAFKIAHKNAGNHSHLYIGHPHFEGFEVIDGI